jgi:hypothetical protein
LLSAPEAQLNVPIRRDEMLKQYLILNMCLSELRKLQRPNVERFKLEILIIQIKRLLLEDEIEARIKDDAVNEGSFIELHAKLKNTHGSDFDSMNMEDLIHSADKVKHMLTEVTNDKSIANLLMRKCHYA